MQLIKLNSHRQSILSHHLYWNIDLHLPIFGSNLYNTFYLAAGKQNSPKCATYQQSSAYITELHNFIWFPTKLKWLARWLKTKEMPSQHTLTHVWVIKLNLDYVNYFWNIWKRTDIMAQNFPPNNSLELGNKINQLWLLFFYSLQFSLQMLYTSSMEVCIGH